MTTETNEEKKTPRTRNMGAIKIEEPNGRGWDEIEIEDSESKIPEFKDIGSAQKWLGTQIENGALEPGRYRIIRVAKVLEAKRVQAVAFSD